MPYIKSLLVLLLCCQVLSAAQKPDPEKYLTIGLMADITAIYPWGDVSLETHYVAYNVFETLVRFRDGSTEIEPCLATKITSPDYKIWTVNLRKDVKFHDGTPLNADAVIQSFSLHAAFRNNITKPDDYSLVFHLDKPNVSFPLTLAMAYYSIASPSTVRCFKTKCKALLASGTGPFKFDHWTPDKEIVLISNNEYWDQKPFFHKVIFKPFKDDSELVKALTNKTVLIAPTIAPNTISDIREIPYLKFRSLNTLTIGFLAMNTEKKPFNNAKVRSAVSYAINTKELLKKYFYAGQTGIIANTFTTDQMLALNDESLEKNYNPEKTKALLKEAGYPNGFDTTLMPTPVRRPYMPDPVHIAEDIKTDLAAVKINATIVMPESRDDFGIIVQKGNYEMLLYGWLAETVDPNDFLSALLSTASINKSNIPRWSNAQFDSFLEKGSSQSNTTERMKIYHQAQLLFHQEMPFVPLFNPLRITVWNEKVSGYIPHPLNRLYLQYIALTP
jgi:peptide/nickel transport system substrate-binding protein